jgi:hypothetical protein
MSIKRNLSCLLYLLGENDKKIPALVKAAIIAIRKKCIFDCV